MLHSTKDHGFSRNVRCATIGVAIMLFGALSVLGSPPGLFETPHYWTCEDDQLVMSEPLDPAWLGAIPPEELISCADFPDEEVDISPKEEEDSTPSWGGGGGEDCEDYQLDGSEPTLNSEYPIDLRRGDKVIKVNDLVIDLPGDQDFVFDRQYTSDPQVISNRSNRLGQGWASSHFNRVWEYSNAPGNTSSDIAWANGTNSSTRFRQVGTTGVFKSAPNLRIWAEYDPTTKMKVHEPGRWTKQFPAKTAFCESHITRTGYEFVYQWNNITTDQGSVYNVLRRIDIIDRYGGLQYPIALIYLDWELITDVSTGNQQMRIRQLDVLRPGEEDLTDAQQTRFFWTHRVYYTYQEEVVNGTGDLGGFGDLVQVEYGTATDQTFADADWDAEGIPWYIPSTPAGGLANTFGIVDGDPLINVGLYDGIRYQVRQYRYYDGDSDPDGLDGQIKMIIEPEQIEYFISQTGQQAKDLLAMADAGLAIGGESLPVRDLASKLLTYYVDDDLPNGEIKDHVATQRIQTNCGCSGASLGKEITYRYKDFTADPSAPTDGEFGLSIEQDERIWDGVSAYQPYRTIWYDMMHVQLANTGNAASDYDLFPRAITHQEWAVSNGRTWTYAYDYVSYGNGGGYLEGYPGQRIAVHNPSATSYGTRASVTTSPSITVYNGGDDGSGGTLAVKGLTKRFRYHTWDNLQSMFDTSSWQDESDVYFLRRLRSIALDDPEDDPLATGDPYSLQARYFYKNVSGRNDIIEKVEEFRDSGIYIDPSLTSVQAGDTADDVETTEIYSKLRSSGGSMLPVEIRETYRERELAGSENGTAAFTHAMSLNNPNTIPSNIYATVEHFDTLSRIEKIERDDGTFTDYEYADKHHPNPTAITDDYVGSGGVGRLRETRTYDIMGRLITARQPNGATINIIRLMDSVAEEDPDGAGALEAPSRYAEMVLPPDSFIDTQNPSNNTWAGPITTTYYTSENKPVAVLGHAISAIMRDTTTGDITGTAFVDPRNTVSPQLSKTIIERDVAALVTSERRYHDTSSSSGYYETLYEYDNVGRVSKIAQQVDGTEDSVTRYTYDIFDRMLTESVGTDSTSTGNFRTTRAYFYDYVIPGGVNVAADLGVLDNLSAENDQGAGDGNLTVIHEYAEYNGAAPVIADTRITYHQYDFRNRRESTYNSLKPHEIVRYDNLDRVTDRTLWGETVLPSDADNPFADDVSTSEFSIRLLFETRNFSQRGLMYRKQVAIDPRNVLASGSLEWHTFFDPVGRTLASWQPNGPVTKNVYDGYGRLKTRSTTDGGGDALPGAAGCFADATGFTGDHVIEEVDYTYTDTNETTAGYADLKQGAGDVTLVTSRMRPHSSSASGALTAQAADVDKPIQMYSGIFYDLAGRPVAQADYGTNQANDDFKIGGAAPTIDQANPPAPSASGSVIVNLTSYNKRGLVDISTDPDGDETKYEYDDLDRTVAVIENYVDGAMTLSASQAWGYDFNPNNTSASTDDDDDDVATIIAYNGLDDVVHRVAAVSVDETATTYQDTEYEYGVTISGGSGLDSNGLLARVIYPDDTPSSSIDDYSVRYQYNTLGEVIQVTDQNGSVHEYTRDALGRITLDDVTTLGTDIGENVAGVNVDTWADKIQFFYENNTTGRPLLDQVQTFNGTTRLNTVDYEYNLLWQLSQVTQDPDQSSAKTITLTYDQKNFGAGNYSRILSQDYPSNSGSTRTVVDYLYGDGSDYNDAISRFTDLQWRRSFDSSAQEYTYYRARYSYVGMSTPVTTRYGTWDAQATAGSEWDGTVSLDRVVEHSTRISTAGTYAGLDRWGRVKQQLWVAGDSDFDSPTPTPTDWYVTTGSPLQPEIFDLSYTYDTDSNVLRRWDERAGGTTAIATNASENYSYDGLDRLIQDERGKWDTGSSSWMPGGTRSMEWTELDPLGNWLKVVTDVDSDGVYEYSGNDDLWDDRSSPAAHSDANEVNAQLIGGSGTGALTHKYDRNGNLIEKQILVGGAVSTWRYRYDAWNRLVKATVQPDQGTEQDRAAYTYNGLHQRATRAADDLDMLDGVYDTDTRFYYDGSWRLVEESVTERTAAGPGSSLTQRVWSPHYIDALIFTQTETNDDELAVDAVPSGNFTTQTGGESETALFALSDRKYDVIAMINAPHGAGPIGMSLKERVRYNAYGVARCSPLGDINGDGAVDSAELGQMISKQGTLNGDGSYAVDVDLNLDGAIDSADLGILISAFGTGGAFEGQVSDLGNTIGYSGYVYDKAVDLYLARHRWHDARLGRWVSRDPLEYIDSENLYQYCKHQPIKFQDPFGLSTEQEVKSALESLCSTYKNKCSIAPSCTYNQCMAEAAEIAKRYKDAVDKIRNGKGYAMCSEQAETVKKGLFSGRKSKSNPDGKYSCFAFAQGTVDRLRYTHAFILGGHRCGGDRASFRLDPFKFSSIRGRNRHKAKPRIMLPPEGPYDRFDPLEIQNPDAPGYSPFPFQRPGKGRYYDPNSPFAPEE